MENATTMLTTKPKKDNRKATLASIQARKERKALARELKDNNIPLPPTPIVIKNVKDISRVAKDMATSLANKDGRFTVAEIRVFQGLVDIITKSEEQLKTQKAMSRLLKEHSQSQ